MFKGKGSIAATSGIGVECYPLTHLLVGPQLQHRQRIALQFDLLARGEDLKRETLQSARHDGLWGEARAKGPLVSTADILAWAPATAHAPIRAAHSRASAILPALRPFEPEPPAQPACALCDCCRR